jgi:hypothetical protein
MGAHGRELEQAENRIAELETALESRIVIEQAKGVLRERFGWSLDEAFDVLRYAARSSRTKIHELAGDVVGSEQTPHAIAVAIARSARWRAAAMVERAEAQRARTAELERVVRAQQERLAWEEQGRDKRRRRTGDRSDILGSVASTAQTIEVETKSYESARQLLRHVLDTLGDAVIGDLEYGPNGPWHVRLHRPDSTAWTYGSDEPLRRVLTLVQAWVDEKRSDADIVIGERHFVIRAR